MIIRFFLKKAPTKIKKLKKILKKILIILVVNPGSVIFMVETRWKKILTSMVFDHCWSSSGEFLWWRPRFYGEFSVRFIQYFLQDFLENFVQDPCQDPVGCVFLWYKKAMIKSQDPLKSIVLAAIAFEIILANNFGENLTKFFD